MYKLIFILALSCTTIVQSQSADTDYIILVAGVDGQDKQNSALERAKQNEKEMGHLDKHPAPVGYDRNGCSPGGYQTTGPHDRLA